MEPVSAIPQNKVAVVKLKDYAQLTKFRLALLVVFSAAMAFLLASDGAVDWIKFTWLIVAGFLITGSSNAFNQIIEKDLDKLMDRTAMRPLPDKRMHLYEAMIVAFLIGIAGVVILYLKVNMISSLLGLFSLISYVFMYTPMKRISPFSVFIGAIPGAMPALLGWVAVTGHFSMAALVLFVIQFLWQFPHFWAIAWVMDEDYKKAGFEMLPTKQRDKGSARQTVVYTLALIPACTLPLMYQIAGWPSMIVCLITSFWFLSLAIKLYRDCSVEAARKLMFGSFAYLPIVQIALVLDKTILM